MIRSLVTCMVLAGFLGLAAASGARAADSKEKLPKPKTDSKPAVEAPKAKPSESTGASKGSDQFIDNNHDGVNDRHETKVIRPEEQKPPSTVKTETAPPKVNPPPAKKPPGL